MWVGTPTVNVFRMSYQVFSILLLSRNVIHQLCRVLTILNTNDEYLEIPLDGVLLLRWADTILQKYLIIKEVRIDSLLKLCISFIILDYIKVFELSAQAKADTLPLRPHYIWWGYSVQFCHVQQWTWICRGLTGRIWNSLGITAP